MNEGGLARSVLVVTHYYPAHGGGVEIVAGEVAQRIVASGATVEWFASDTDDVPDLPRVRCRPQRALNWTERALGVPFPLWSPASMARLVGAVRRHDVVHVHDVIYFANMTAALTAIVLRKRLVVTQHVGEIPYRDPVLRALLAAANRFVASTLLRKARHVAFVSPVVRRYFEGLGGARGSFLDVPNGVDTVLFSPIARDAREVRKRSLGLRPERPLALFVGRFVEKKGLRLVRAVAESTKGWQWCIAGHGPIDPASWGLDHVRVLGRLTQSQLASWYQVADVLVLPSVGEGFPLVVQEALAAGLPVAVHTETRDAGSLPSEICVAADVNGDDAVMRWTAALRSLIEAPAEMREAQRAACREHAVSRWSWAATGKRYEALLFG